MQPLTPVEVREIAALARLALEDAEVERLAVELSRILEHLAAIQELDTTGVEPMTHAVPMTLRLRDDAAEPSLPVERALGGAPDKEDSFFRVPHIIEER